MATGDFVVVWQDDADENGLWEVMARGFNNDGSQRFRDFVVNTVSANNQVFPSVATSEIGFVVVWCDGINNGIKARGFYPNGSQRFAQLSVSRDSSTPWYGYRPRVAMASDGSFVVAWTLGDNYSSWIRAFNPDGTPRFNELEASFVDALDLSGDYYRHPGHTPGGSPDVAIAEDGSFVVGYARTSGYTYIRGFNSDGTVRFGSIPFALSERIAYNNPAISMDPSGSLIVVCECSFRDVGRTAGPKDIFVHGFGQDGARRFVSVNVSTDALGPQLRPAIAIDSSGDFVVVWEDDRDRNEYFDIRGRMFSSDGSPLGSDFQVNTVSKGQQYLPQISTDRAGRFVVVWQDDNDENGYWEILCRGISEGRRTYIADMTVNSVSTGQQVAPCVAMEASTCPITALGMARDALNMMRQIRGELLLTNSGGRRWVGLLERNARELMRIVLSDRQLLEYSRALLSKIISEVRGGPAAMIGDELLAELKHFIERIPPGSAELQLALQEAHRDLQFFCNRTIAEALRAAGDSRRSAPQFSRPMEM